MLTNYFLGVENKIFSQLNREMKGKTFPRFAAVSRLPPPRLYLVEGGKGGDFQGLGVGWIIKDVIDEEIDLGVVKHGQQSDMDDFGGPGTQDMDPEDFTGVAMHYHLQEALAFSGDLTTGEFFIKTPADDKLISPRQGLLFGDSDIGNFRDGVDSDRKEAGKTIDALSQGIKCRQASLGDRCGGKTRPADDITHRIDIRHRGLIEFIDLDVAAVTSNTGLVDVEAIGIGLSAEGKKKCICTILAAGFQPDSGSAVFFIYAEFPAVITVLDIASRKIHPQVINDLMVHELQQPGPGIKKSDFNPEGGKDGCIFRTDHPTS